MKRTISSFMAFVMIFSLFFSQPQVQPGLMFLKKKPFSKQEHLLKDSLKKAKM